MSKLSREDESFLLELQRTYRVDNKAEVMRTLELLRSFDRSVLEALNQLDASVIRRSMSGNADAERVLRRLTEFAMKTQVKTPPSSSGKSTASPGPRTSSGGAEKRRADDDSVQGGRPPDKMPRISSGSSMDRGGGATVDRGGGATMDRGGGAALDRGGRAAMDRGGGVAMDRGGGARFQRPSAPFGRSSVQPLLNVGSSYMGDRGRAEWMGGGGPMRGGGMARSGYRPAPRRGQYGRGPYY